MKNVLIAQKYLVDRPLGAGGMGEVFLAKQIALVDIERPVVIKRPFIQSERDADFKEAFLNEARIAAGLDHPNIVTIYDVIEHQGVPHIVMEYLDGADLSRLIRRARARRHAIPVPQALTIARDVASGLAYAHSRTSDDGLALGIVHRDISPQNIVCTQNGSAVIVDFGIAKARSQKRDTLEGVLKGKSAYMSPEQTRGEALDPRSDLFALGIVLYEMLSGAPLFKRSNEIDTLNAVRNAEVRSLTELFSYIDEELDQIVQRLLAREKEERYDDADAFIDAVENYAASKALTLSARRLGKYVKRINPAAMTQMRASEDTTNSLDTPETAPLPPVDLPHFDRTHEVTAKLRAQRNTNMHFGYSQATGREVILREAQGILQAEKHVLFEGGEGLGKTFLAQKLAEKMRDAYLKAGGVWFVDLTHTDSIGRMLNDIANAIGFRLDPHASLVANLRQCGETLKERGPTLVLLDGCRAEIAPQTAIDALSQAAPELRFIMTGQRPFAINDAEVVSVGVLDDASSISLLRSHIKNAQHSDAELRRVSEILNGVPLALMLAAARLSDDKSGAFLKAILSESDPTTLLKTPSHLLERAFEASWQSFTSEDQEGLAALSTFAKGFSVDAAALLLERTRKETLLFLDRMARGAFVRVHAVAHNAQRYSIPRIAKRWITTLRYNFARAQERAQAATLQVCEVLVRSLNGPLQLSVTYALRAERENLKAIVRLQSGGDRKARATVLRALACLNGTFRGHERQAYLLLLNEALGACDELDLVGRAPFFALEARGDIHRELANDEAAERDYLKALDIAKKGERDRWCEAIAWRNLGSLRAKSSDELNIRYTSDDQGIEELWRARRLFDKLGDRHFEARVVVSLAHALLSRQQIKEAQKLFVDAQTTFRSVGDLIFEARAMRGCGLTYTAQNDHRTALAAYQAAWRLSEVASDAKGAAFAAIHQTRTHRALNADNACERAFEKARRLLVRSGHTQLRLNWCKSAANFVDNPERYLKEAKALALALAERPAS